MPSALQDDPSVIGVTGRSKCHRRYRTIQVSSVLQHQPKVPSTADNLKPIILGQVLMYLQLKQKVKKILSDRKIKTLGVKGPG